MPTPTARTFAATNGREEEAIRRYGIINGLIKEHSPVNQKETIKRFAGVVTSAWANYLKTGRVSANTIKHMAEFTGLSEGVFDCSANFGSKQEKAIAEAFRTKIIDTKTADEVKSEEVEAEAIVPKVETIENSDAETECAVVEAQAVETKAASQPADKISVIEIYIAALKATDALGLEDVEDAVALVSALSQKVGAKKFELEALNKING